ncbi:hypothetical protein KUCAC02_008894, partial [Chaenocephalus aceratus]
DNRDDSAAASCSSRGEPGLTLDQPHPPPPAPYLLHRKVKKYWTLGMKAATALLLTLRLRGQFDEAKSATHALATKWGSQTQFETTRARKVKRHFDELSEDSRLTDAESNFG